ncbi:MAG: GIY-YIG nuclease family protein [Waterburya sp.]
MYNLEIFTQETANNLFNSSEQFPVDFDDAWRWLEYSKKDKAKDYLIANLEEGIDYVILSNGCCYVTYDGLYFWSGNEDTPASLAVHKCLFKARKSDLEFKHRLARAMQIFKNNYDKHKKFLECEIDIPLSQTKISLDKPIAQCRHGFIYLLETEEFYKIGFSSVSGESRIKALQTGNPLKISFVSEFAAQANVEKEIHQKFRAFRVKGEWFRKNTRILKFFRQAINRGKRT